MKLEKLLEDISGKGSDKAEVKRNNKKLVDIAKKTTPMSAPATPAQPQQQVSAPAQQTQQPKKPSTKGKTFKFTFKDDKGSYQVRVKKNKEGKLKYNYGYYDRDDMPEISINTEALTDEAKDKYTEFKKFIKAVETGNGKAKT